MTVFQLDSKTGEEGETGVAFNFNDEATCIAADGKDRWVWLGSKEGNLARLVPGASTGWGVFGMMRRSPYSGRPYKTRMRTCTTAPRAPYATSTHRRRGPRITRCLEVI